MRQGQALHAHAADPEPGSPAPSAAPAPTGTVTGRAAAERPVPSVWALVLNFNSHDDTLGCVAALRGSDYPGLHILVLDNASPDGGGKLLQAALCDDEFVQLPINTGYAGGNNEGISRALAGGARYVFIVNPDARVAPHCVSRFVASCETDPGIGALNSIEVERDGVTIDPFFARSVMADAGVVALRADDTRIPAAFTAPRLFGAALFLPAHAIERVGGFDPLYFAYWEEFDLCRRLQLHGYKLLVSSAAPVVHLRTNEHRGVSRFVVFLRLKSTYLERLKDPGVHFSVALRFVARKFWRQLLRGGARNEYPFTLHKIDRGLILQSGWWVLRHIVAIRRHRELEIRGRAHV